MMKSSHKCPAPLHQTGFTLVEIMVGLAIGMLATIVIMQVFSVFEAQKRVTTGTADAQTNGSIALYTIGRDLKQAGYSLMPVADSAIECTTLTLDGTANYPIAYLSPVVLADGPSDTIAIHYGETLGGGVPSRISTVIGNEVAVGSNVACRTGDRTLVINGADCAMSIASAVSASSSSVTPTVTLTDTSLVVPNVSALACLGTWREVIYSISSDGNLLRDGKPAIAGIVNIQAQYGISASANSNQIVNWVNPSGVTWGPTTTTPTVGNRNLIKAIRIAVVARNAKREASAVTSPCTTTQGTVNNGPCAWEDAGTDPAPAINLSNDADGTSWKNYRYRVFETIIPLRNVIWSRSTL